MRSRYARRTAARLALTAALALGLDAPPAAAQSADDAKRVAMTNAFNAGAQAYKAGQYLAAAEAFEKAYALLPSSALLFSAAQAYRRQYLAAASADTLRRAIELYREYLRVDPQANRREDAMEALQTLVPLERIQVGGPPPATGDPGAAPEASPPDAAPKRTARILVSADTDGAEASLDGGPFAAAPLVASVEPGPHRVRLRAKGHDEEEISLQAVAHEQVQRHVDLRPKPAKLEVTGTSGARVSVDGKLVASLPDAPAIPLDPGAHIVSVTLGGREPLARRIEAAADQSIRLTADLPLTTQRKVAWAGLGASVLGLAASGVLTGITFARQGEAVALDERPASAPLTPAELRSYNRAVNERDDFGQAAAFTAGASALVFAVSLGLFVLDEPPVLVPVDSKPGTDKPGPRTTLEVGLGSAGLRVQF